MLNGEQKKLYRSAAHLLSGEYVQYYIKRYPQRNISHVAHRGLAAACRKFDPEKGHSFLRYAAFFIHFYLKRYEFSVIPPEEKEPCTRFHHELRRTGEPKHPSIKELIQKATGSSGETPESPEK